MSEESGATPVTGTFLALVLIGFFARLRARPAILGPPQKGKFDFLPAKLIDLLEDLEIKHQNVVK